MSDDAAENGPNPIVVRIPNPFTPELHALLEELRFRNRFIVSADAQQLITHLTTFARDRHCSLLRAGEIFYRARTHDFAWLREWSDAFPSKEMGAPPREKARANRLNPEGIPYLYMATDEATAVAEVRPWTRAFVSVARLRLSRDLRVADFCPSSADAAPTASGDAEWIRDAEWMWDRVGDAFTVPYHPDDSLRYVPTQYLAEAFKAAQFDGISYPSWLSPSKGQNIALFDVSAAVPVDPVAKRVYVKRIQHEYREL